MRLEQHAVSRNFSVVGDENNILLNVVIFSCRPVTLHRRQKDGFGEAMHEGFFDNLKVIDQICEAVAGCSVLLPLRQG